MAFLLLIAVVLCTVRAIPIVLKESSPSGHSVVAIVTSDPEFEKYLRDGFPKDLKGDRTLSQDIGDDFRRSFSIATSGKAVAGTGRSFASASAFNPFMLPFFVNPINVEGLGRTDMGLNNWFKSIENFYDPSFAGAGGVQAVSVVNDNGHIYGKVNNVPFDNKTDKKDIKDGVKLLNN